jgi:hypothetical protein
MRVTQTIVGGAMAEWWQCGNCQARFELADSSRESMEDVGREVLCRAFEDGTELIPAFHEWYDASQWFWWGRALGAFIGTEARKREQRARAEGEAKGRREALGRARPFTRHLNNCDVLYRRTGTDESMVCTCGLDKLLAALAEGGGV